MPSLVELQNAINDLLGLIAVPAVLQLNSPTRERAFEAYVFSLLVRAVRNLGGTVVLRGILSGDNPSPVIFRGGPGRLGSRLHNYAFAFCTLGNKEFEIHVDVQYQGSSGAIHEVDVSLYDHRTADAIREAPQGANLFPSSRKLYGAVECKFYDDDLNTALGRTFVGLVSDCGSLRVKSFVSNGHHAGLRLFLGPPRPDRFLRLSPLNADEEARFVRFAEQTLRQWAKV
jgi:hypothetical protein